jgi:hypothetical protein
VTFTITAPALITEQHSVFLSVRSSATTEHGEETAVAERAMATLTGVPPASADASNDLPALAVVDSGNLNCTQSLPVGSDVIDVGEVAEFSCTHAPGPVRFRVNSLTAHWEYRVGDGPWSSVSGAASLSPASGNGGQDVTYVIQLRFAGNPDQVPPGSTGQVTVEITNAAGNSLNPAAIATLGATRASVSVPTSDDLGMACEPDTVVASVGGDAIEATCTVSGEDTLGDRTVTLTQVLVVSPEGWAVSGEGTASGSTLTYTPNQSIGPGVAYTFSFFLTPVSCNTEAGTITLSSSFTHDGSVPIAGPATSLTANVSGPLATTIIASGRPLDFGTSSWNGTEYSVVRGSLALTISGTAGGACPGTAGTWSIQVSTDGLSTVDTNEQIPAEAITYLGSQSNLDIPDGLIPVGADIPLAPGVTTTIASGDGSIGSGATWNPIFQLDPPNTAPAGTYSGTILIEVVNAP